MATADLPCPDKGSPAPIVMISSLTLLAGVSGMAASLFFLGSHSHLDVISGAVGFLAGVVLVATGLISLAVQSRSPATGQAATRVAGCLVAFLPPTVAVLAWPTLHLGLPALFSGTLYFGILGELLADVLMPFVSLGCIGWAWIQGPSNTGYLSELFGLKRIKLFRVIVFTSQLLAICTTLIAYTPIAHWCTRSQGEHMAWSDIKDRSPLNLPKSASDIRFYQHWHPDRVLHVDFAIDENTFLVWASSQGWSLSRTSGAISIWPRAYFGDWTTKLVVRDGYHFDTYGRGATNTFSVTFDRDNQRAYYDFHSERLGED